jgi:hypothetical protein
VDAVGDGVAGDVVGVPEPVGVGLALVGGGEVGVLLLSVGDGVGLGDDEDVVLGSVVAVAVSDPVGLGDAVAVSASRAPPMGSTENDWVRSFSPDWPERAWLAVTWIEHDLTVVWLVLGLRAKSTPTMPEETIVRPATRLNAGVVVCRMLIDALATVVS